MKVVPVPVREDNYAYLLIDSKTSEAAVVDPYDMKKVLAAAEREKVTIVANLTTHHHYDHSGGNKDFINQFSSKPIYGGSDKGSADKIVGDNDEFIVSENLNVKCLATPCHTQDSICYFVTDKSESSQPGAVFTGDTLFQGGCGRFFEGDAPSMHKALSYLGSLPAETIVYNGHEYTKSNLKFAKSVEPKNPALQSLENLVNNNAVTTGHSTIADEKEWNVFMRLGSAEILQNIQAPSNAPPEDVMDILRTKKNNS